MKLPELGLDPLEMVISFLPFDEQHRSAAALRSSYRELKSIVDQMKSLSTMGTLRASQVQIWNAGTSKYLPFNAEDPTFSQLRHLKMQGSSITQKELVKLVEKCSNVESLIIRNCPNITDLSILSAMPKLQSLKISNLMGLRRLSLPRLENVTVENCQALSLIEPSLELVKLQVLNCNGLTFLDLREQRKLTQFVFERKSKGATWIRTDQANNQMIRDALPEHQKYFARALTADANG